MADTSPLATIVLFDTRRQARRHAIEHPDDVGAVLSGHWPPHSRDELKDFARLLRRSQAAAPSSLAAYLFSRFNRTIKAIGNRMQRHRQTSTWTVPAPNGRVLHFPINDPASTDFKTMVDRYDGFYEKTLIEFVCARIGPGDVFVDVGANVGYIAAFAASTGAAVFAMEIQRDLLPLIEQMATINGFDHLRVLHVGASTRSGLSMMPRIEANPGTRLEGQTAAFAGHDPMSVIDDFVPMMTLDDAFAEPGLLPRLVKVDVEGHEIGVLEGARRIIAAGRTTFVVEYHPHLVAQYRRSPEDLFAPFDRGRWTVSQLTDDGLRPLAGIADVAPDPRDPNPKLVFEPRG